MPNHPYILADELKLKNEKGEDKDRKNTYTYDAAKLTLAGTALAFSDWPVNDAFRKNLISTNSTDIID